MEGNSITKLTSKAHVAAHILAVWFGVGLLPRAPGTWGSLAALPLAYSLAYWGGIEVLTVATIIIFVIGVWVSGVVSRELGVSDPSKIVIDEVAGQWLTLLAVPPDIILYLFGFFLFRIFDIFKPWPISWADKQIKGGMGIMLDDIIAGIYAGIFLWAGNFIFLTYNLVN
jgi:phosphatidylglycerophosphatase A